MNSDGTINIRSTDNENIAQVSISPNGFQISVTYLHLLPYKKPNWVQVGELDKNTIGLTGSSRRLKMAYEYA